MTVHKLNSQANHKSNVLQSKSQAEIIASRRKARRARINAIHNRVSNILDQNNEMPSSITEIDHSMDRNLYEIYTAAKEVAASKE